MFNILAIESSCDETAVAVTQGREVLSSVIASQVDEHKLYGGVVPEIASRRHIEAISGLTEQALKEAGCGPEEIGAVAVTYAPGLIGALLVGVNFAKAFGFGQGIPLIPVHHLRSHIAANYIAAEELEPPFLALVVSGGHSHIVDVAGYTDFKIIGRTRDDAAGECFDKTARAMGLPYPGGVYLDKTASKDRNRYSLPKPSVDGSVYDFSFSGLKTAVVNLLHNSAQKGEPVDIPALCAGVRGTVCDLLLDHTLRAAAALRRDRIVLAGGVSANSELRARFETACAGRGYKLYLPPVHLCGDNAAMVGVQGYYEYLAGRRAGANLNAYATRSIEMG